MTDKQSFSTTKYFNLENDYEEKIKKQVKESFESVFDECVILIKDQLDFITNTGRLPARWTRTKNSLNQPVLKSGQNYVGGRRNFDMSLCWRIRIVKDKVTIIFQVPYRKLKPLLLKRKDITSKFGRLYWCGHRIKLTKANKVKF